METLAAGDADKGSRGIQACSLFQPPTGSFLGLLCPTAEHNDRAYACDKDRSDAAEHDGGEEGPAHSGVVRPQRQFGCSHALSTAPGLAARARPHGRSRFLIAESIPCLMGVLIGCSDLLGPVGDEAAIMRAEDPDPHIYVQVAKSRERSGKSGRLSPACPGTVNASHIAQP